MRLNLNGVMAAQKDDLTPIDLSLKQRSLKKQQPAKINLNGCSSASSTTLPKCDVAGDISALLQQASSCAVDKTSHEILMRRHSTDGHHSSVGAARDIRSGTNSAFDLVPKTPTFPAMPFTGFPGTISPLLTSLLALQQQEKVSTGGTFPSKLPRTALDHPYSPMELTAALQLNNAALLANRYASQSLLASRINGAKHHHHTAKTRPLKSPSPDLGRRNSNSPTSTSDMRNGSVCAQEINGHRHESNGSGHRSSGDSTSNSSPEHDSTGSGANGNSTSADTNGSGVVRPVAEEHKDEAYWERRRKNNEAAKRSRDARRQKEDEIAIRAAVLEQENMKLRFEVAALKGECEKLRNMLFNA